MSTVTIELAPGISSWGYEGQVYPGGQEHKLDVTGDREFREALAAAAAAGVLSIKSGSLPESVVESDEDSLAKYDTATEARAKLMPERDAELNITPQDEQAEVALKWERVLEDAAQNALEG